MKVGIVLENENGLTGDVCAHFGQCKYFFIADVDNEKKKVVSSKIVPNNAQHGGGGCVAVDEILKHAVTHVIAGGMGMGAQQKFAGAGVKVFGYSGKAQAALEDLMNNTLGGLDACRDHGVNGACH